MSEFVIDTACIEGGSLYIDPEFHRFQGCALTCVKIRMLECASIFYNCFFTDCDLDDNTLASIRYGLGNIVRNGIMHRVEMTMDLDATG